MHEHGTRRRVQTGIPLPDSDVQPAEKQRKPRGGKAARARQPQPQANDAPENVQDGETASALNSEIGASKHASTRGRGGGRGRGRRLYAPPRRTKQQQEPAVVTDEPAPPQLQAQPDATAESVDSFVSLKVCICMI